MAIQGKYLKIIMILATSACMPGLVGCGGGGGGGESSSIPGSSTNSSSASDPRGGGSSLGSALLCAAVVLISGDDECATAALSGSSTPSGSGGGSTGSGGPTPPTSGNRSYLMTDNEIEPNDDLINANIPRFATRTDPSDQTGWIVDGSANDVDDTRDSFALTPRRAYRYRIALCPPGQRACENLIGMDPLTLFWRLLDQDGNEIASSQGAGSNKMHVALEAGLIYYVVVDAGDTMGATVEYKLWVFEQS